MVVEDQAKKIAMLVAELRRVKPSRHRMSHTRSVWIAGRTHFKCATADRDLCPCWVLRDGSFSSEGWQVDHSHRWSKTFDDRDDNCAAICATCHFRKTKEEMLEDEDD